MPEGWCFDLINWHEENGVRTAYVTAWNGKYGEAYDQALELLAAQLEALALRARRVRYRVRDRRIALATTVAVVDLTRCIMK